VSLGNDLSGAHDSLAEDARLFILKELAAQNDGRLNAILAQRLLRDRYGMRRSREWVETQMRKLAELEAVHLHEIAVLTAEIVRAGRDHLDKISIIVGVTRPHEVE
tara:strand:- start:955 stop:1272 length:318 start_codon:yes stop_codon:yes gene_type:complete